MLLLMLLFVRGVVATALQINSVFVAVSAFVDGVGVGVIVGMTVRSASSQINNSMINSLALLFAALR
jgi:hypothetical protein